MEAFENYQMIKKNCMMKMKAWEFDALMRKSLVSLAQNWMLFPLMAGMIFLFAFLFKKKKNARLENQWKWKLVFKKFTI